MSWHGWLLYNTVILILCVCANIIYFLLSKFKLVCLWIVNVQIIFECVYCLNIIWVLFIFNAWHLYSFTSFALSFADTCTHSVPIFVCGIATFAHYDVKELIRLSLFSPGHDFKNPFFGVFEAKYLWTFLSISGKTYIIRIVSLRRIFEKKMAMISYAL